MSRMLLVTSLVFAAACQVKTDPLGPNDLVADGGGLRVGAGGTLEIDPAAIPGSLSGSCEAGEAITAIGTDGTLTCTPTIVLDEPSCLPNQIPKWNGTAWVCANDIGGGGTVTSIATGAALTGGPITTSGSIDVAVGGITSGHVLDRTIGFIDWSQNSCGADQVPQWDGLAWVCAGVGDITAVLPGAGLLNGGLGGDATLDINFAGSGSLDTVARSDHTHGGCTGSDKVTGFDAMGNALCGSDLDTTYTPGFGLSLAGTTFGLDPSKIAVGTYNLGLNLSGTTLTIVSADGSALSPANPGYVVMPTASGTVVAYAVEDPGHYYDGSLAVGSFETVTARPWSEPRPFMLYAVEANGGVYFALSLVPHATTTPLAGKIALRGDSTADTQDSFAILSDVPGDYASKIVLPVGSIRLTRGAIGEFWTVVPIDSGDGVGRLYNFEGRRFLMPEGQMGADLSSYFSVVGGVAPQYQGYSEVAYKMGRDGVVDVEFTFIGNAGGTAGSGGALSLFLPYLRPTVYHAYGSGSFRAVNTNPMTCTPTCFDVVGTTEIPTNSAEVSFQYQVPDPTDGLVSAKVTGNDQNTSSREIRGHLRYHAFAF